MIPVRANARLFNDYDAANYIGEPADSTSDKNDYALLQGSIADPIRKRYGRNDANLEDSKAGDE